MQWSMRVCSASTCGSRSKLGGGCRQEQEVEMMQAGGIALKQHAPLSCVAVPLTGEQHTTSNQQH